MLKLNTEVCWLCAWAGPPTSGAVMLTEHRVPGAWPVKAGVRFPVTVQLTGRVFCFTIAVIIKEKIGMIGIIGIGSTWQTTGGSGPVWVRNNVVFIGESTPAGSASFRCGRRLSPRHLDP